jgi:DNA-binding NtrC family response regulator
MRRVNDPRRVLEGARILVVDDEYLIALELESILRDAGATVVVICTSLEEGLDALEHDGFDVAVLDVRLGSDTSEPIARGLVDRGVGFIFYSGQSLPTAVQQTHPEAPLLVKPLRPAAVVHAVSRQLRDADRDQARS